MDAKKCHTRWCFTSWDFNRLTRLNKDLFEVIVVGIELAPTTNTLHYQGYCRTKKAYSLGSIKKIVDGKGHFEIAYSTEEDCINYCKKGNNMLICKEEVIDIFDIFCS